jgi:DNA mismatch repair protein MutS
MNSAPGNGSRTHGAPLPHFQSILFDRPESVGTDPRQEPPFFADLNLDQIVAAVTAGREEYALEPYLFAPLRDVEAVEYRHEVLRDLEHVAVIESIRGFAERMRAMRKHLGQAEELHHRFQKESWFLDAVGIYCDAVTSLAGDLARLTVASRGFRGLGAYLTGYVESAAFTALAAQTRELKADLGDVRYAVHIRGNRVKVSPYAGEADYAAEVEATFARFKERSARDFGMKVAGAAHMDHVEAQVLEGVARLNPDVFRRLDEFCAQHASVVDPVVATFDREAQFYLAYLEHIGRLQAAGLAFCIPRVCARSTEVSAADAFDLALAAKLAPHAPVVRNDFHLSDPERILVVTGPNQGGKTTFARMFGQLHHLAGLGLPVPAREARLFLPDRIFTHFERDEDLATLRGKLEDELVRIHAILQRATSESVVVMNESFTSTTLDDALLIGTGVMTELLELGSLAVCVTFVDELASLSEATVSMVGTVVPDDPAVRTYKIVRKPADGLAHAWAIAERSTASRTSA